MSDPLIRSFLMMRSMERRWAEILNFEVVFEGRPMAAVSKLILVVYCHKLLAIQKHGNWAPRLKMSKQPVGRPSGRSNLNINYLQLRTKQIQTTHILCRDVPTIEDSQVYPITQPSPPKTAAKGLQNGRINPLASQGCKFWGSLFGQGLICINYI